MITFLSAVFLIVHGLLHPGVWTAPRRPGESPPFDPGHSWALTAVHIAPEPVRAIALSIAWYIAVVYTVAGAGLLAGSTWWPTAALVGAAGGLVLKTLWFDPWLTVGVLLDVGVIVAVACTWPASVY
ncbi:hypothetical protein [Streptomyces sp. NPDC046939]|uniref:hypothetical protein n=1 Tax=Streptomyces sp. NPDC046939 TaxID=3155376 RepID=UPI0033C9F6CD